MSKITERLIARVWSSSGVLVFCEDVTSYPLDVVTSWLVDLEGRGRKVCFKRYVGGWESEPARLDDPIILELEELDGEVRHEFLG